MRMIGLSAEEILDRISGLQKVLKAKQELCPHPAGCISYCYGADTGNWDRSQDSWWTDLYCSECKKKWTERDDSKVKTPTQFSRRVDQKTFRQL